MCEMVAIQDEFLAYRSFCRIFQLRFVSIGQIAG